MLYGGEGLAALLLSAAGGYWVLERSDGHKGELRRVGRLLGSVIIIVSLLSIVLRAASGCGMSKGGGWSCPFTGKMHGWDEKSVTIPAPAAETKKR